MPDQNQQNPGGNSGGGRRGGRQQQQGGIHRSVEAAANYAGTKLGSFLGNRPAAKELSEWLTKSFDPTAVQMALVGLQIGAPNVIRTPTMVIDALDKLGFKNRAVLEEVVDEFTMDLIMSFLIGIANQSANPAAVYQTTEEAGKRLDEVALKRRLGLGPYQVVNYLRTTEIRQAYARIIESLPEKERELLHERMRKGEALIRPEDVEGIVATYPTDDTRAREAIFALIGIDLNKKEEKKADPADLTQRIEKIGAQVAGTVDGIKNAFEKYLPPDADRPMVGPEPVSFHDMALATRRVRRLQGGADRRQKDWLDRLLEWFFHPIRSFRRRFGL